MILNHVPCFFGAPMKKLFVNSIAPNHEILKKSTGSEKISKSSP